MTQCFRLLNHNWRVLVSQFIWVCLQKYGKIWYTPGWLINVNHFRSEHAHFEQPDFQPLSRFLALPEEVLLSFCSMCITYLVVLLEALLPGTPGTATFASDQRDQQGPTNVKNTAMVYNYDVGHDSVYNRKYDI